jgi:DNA repair protein RadC
LVVARNHPAGDPAPSQDDIRVTRALREATKIIDIALINHAISGDRKAEPLGVGHCFFRKVGFL